MKALSRVLPMGPSHWVGDGFPVRTAFTYQNAGRELSPFLMLDHGGPTTFEATTQRRGVGEHPHRGFETVTIVYDGEVEHRDSSGGGGTIQAGDVQWMTAGGGIVHEEFHSAAYAQRGGPFHMVQLWVNLPARDKMTAPSYQAITRADIHTVTLMNAQQQAVGHVRLIAGDGMGAQGAARTFTPIQVWDVVLKPNVQTTLPAQLGWGVGALVVAGAITVHGTRVQQGQVAIFANAGEDVRLQTDSGATLLWLSGQPIDETIAGYGPFVMNTREEIMQAMQDFQAGRMGSLAAIDRRAS
jgi:quercetin 2,3-dioxygenase